MNFCLPMSSKFSEGYHSFLTTLNGLESKKLRALTFFPIASQVVMAVKIYEFNKSIKTESVTEEKVEFFKHLLEIGRKVKLIDQKNEFYRFNLPGGIVQAVAFGALACLLQSIVLGAAAITVTAIVLTTLVNHRINYKTLYQLKNNEHEMAALELNHNASRRESQAD